MLGRKEAVRSLLSAIRKERGLVIDCALPVDSSKAGELKSAYSNLLESFYRFECN